MDGQIYGDAQFSKFEFKNLSKDIRHSASRKNTTATRQTIRLPASAGKHNHLN